MGALKLLYRLMVISPIALITWIVGTGRFAADNFETSASTTKQHAAISAYRGVVKATTPLRARDAQPEPTEIRRLARLWIEGYFSGKLVPLTPAFVGDTVQSGVKAEIRACQSALSLKLQQLASKESKKGDTARALEDIRTALVVSQILRASDPLAEAACCMEQGNALTRLRPMLEDLEANQLLDLQSDLIVLKEGAPPLDRLVRQTAVLMQQSQPELSLVEKWGTVVAGAKTKGTMSLRLSDYMASKPKSTRNMPPTIAQLYLGIRAREGLNNEIDSVLNEISMLLNPKQRLG